MIGASTMEKFNLKAGTVAGDRSPALRDRIVFSTEARGLQSSTRAGPTREETERADIQAVALAQPHRRGCDDIRLECALGRFCLNHKPYPLGNHCWLAGIRYLEIVQDSKLAMGFGIRSGGWGSDGGYQHLTDEQLQARKELALIRVRDAEEALRAIMPRLPAAMERLVYDDRDPSPYDEGVLVCGLVKLAQAWGYLRPSRIYA